MIRLSLPMQCLLLWVVIPFGSMILWPGQIVDDPWISTIAMGAPFVYGTVIHPRGRAVFGRLSPRRRWAIRGFVLVELGFFLIDQLMHDAPGRAMATIVMAGGPPFIALLLLIALYQRVRRA